MPLIGLSPLPPPLLSSPAAESRQERIPSSPTELSTSELEEGGNEAEEGGWPSRQLQSVNGDSQLP